MTLMILFQVTFLQWSIKQIKNIYLIFLFTEVDGFITGREMAPAGAKVLVTSLVVANPDGKVRESHDKRVLTRNITERVQETEERIHNGDTTHEVSILRIVLHLEKCRTRDFDNANALSHL